MPVGVHAATVYLYTLLGIQLIVTTFGPLRLYLLRAQKRSFLALCSEACFGVGWATATAMGWYWFHGARVLLALRKDLDTEPQLIFESIKRFGLKIYLVYMFVTLISLWVFKLAFTFMYADLYARTVNIRKHGLYVAAVFVPLSFVAVILAASLECRPLSTTWDIPNLLRTMKICSPMISLRTQSIILVLTLTTDLLLIALPLHILHSLRLTSPEKRAVAFIFLIALLSVTSAVVRFTVLEERGTYGSGRLDSTKVYWMAVLTLLEIAAAEVAFVLPALRRVVLCGGGGTRRRAGSQVMLVRFIKDGNEREVLVDRADEDATVWGFEQR